MVLDQCRESTCGDLWSHVAQIAFPQREALEAILLRRIHRISRYGGHGGYEGLRVSAKKFAIELRAQHLLHQPRRCRKRSIERARNWNNCSKWLAMTIAGKNCRIFRCHPPKSCTSASPRVSPTQ